MSREWLEIKGIKQNNLKNISIKIPHNKVIAVTGVSGSGKSSLAFDTIFAEGQWRFIESLSSYARLFLEKLDRPDVDEVKNIRPAIALEQRNPVRSSRSTVGTLTEIYDLLRVLYAKVSTPYCPECGEEIRKWDTSQVKKELIENYVHSKSIIMFETTESITKLKARGFYRLLINNEIKEVFDLDDTIDKQKHNVVLDRLLINDEARLSDSIEQAWREGNGRIKIRIINKGDVVFSKRNTCDRCDIALPEPMPLLFSFNHPVGACPECKGFGNILKYDRYLIVPDDSLSLSEGAIEPWEKPAARWWKNQMIRNIKKQGIDINKPLKDFKEEEWNLLFEGNKDFYGINDFFEELEEKRYKLHVRVFLSRYRSPVKCKKCHGKRLNNDALSYKISGLDISEMSQMTINRLFNFFKDPSLSTFSKDVAREALDHIRAKLDFLMRVGLDYLTIDRQVMTLSGGEFQRVNLSNQLSSSLAGTLYILDEPTIGLHSRDNRRIARIIKELSEQGNTVIIVEHDPEIIEASDWVLELGPGGGQQGGSVVFSDEINEYYKAETITTRYLKSRTKLQGITYQETVSKRQKTVSRNNKFLCMTGARGNNLKDITIKIPLNKLTVVSGVSGSGKSSLIVETLYRVLARHFRHSERKPLKYNTIEGMKNIRDVRLVDQLPIGRSPRSNPATYIKVFDSIRRLFAQQPEAKIYGYEPGFFSFNISGGRCEVCRGEGSQRLEMYFFEDLFVKCESCHGSRYNKDTLKVKYNGYNISEVLDLTVDGALKLFQEEKTIAHRLTLMKDIGLGYLKIGQPATSISGGEAQRLKICSELGNSNRHGFFYILDEPTIGLHMDDIRNLMTVLRRLVDSNNTVLLIEHNLDVISSTDWVIDLGPEGGEKGGNVVFKGPPDGLINCKESYTGKSLSELYHN